MGGHQYTCHAMQNSAVKDVSQSHRDRLHLSWLMMRTIYQGCVHGTGTNQARVPGLSQGQTRFLGL